LKKVMILFTRGVDEVIKKHSLVNAEF